LLTYQEVSDIESAASVVAQGLYLLGLETCVDAGVCGGIGTKSTI